MEGTLGNLHPSLLQLARPRPLKFSDSIKPNNPAPKTLNFPTNSAAFINMDTISQSGFDTISLASLSQISQYSKPKTSRYFAIDEE
jgi:hypothetical protein